MDSPSKTNSPLFNYINSLSPIKNVKSIPYGSLDFAYPHCIFTSPHVASHKGSRFISYSSDLFKVGSASLGEEVVEEALLETEPPQIDQNDCTTITTPEVIKGGSCEDGQTDLQKMYDSNVKRNSDTTDWEALISTSEIGMVGSPNDSEASRCFLQRSADSNIRSCGGTKSRLEPVWNHNEPESLEALSILHRGVRRQCLDFEIPGNNKQMSGESSSGCVVRSIGMHFNAIGVSSKDNYISNEYSFSRNFNIGLQSSSTPVLPLHDIVRENVIVEAAGQSIQEVSKSSALVEMNRSSPKKKRRKSQQAGDVESSCKRCNCKKSKCLKLYCECFTAGIYCVVPCSCIDCFNKPIHEDTVLATRKQIESRNPLAFVPKVIKNADSIMEGGEDASKTPASVRHKRGCNCRKSNCLKKYCECYQSGVGCSINCRCEGCKNTFGRKDGSLFVGMGIEQDYDNEISGKGGTGKPQQNAELFNPVPLPPPTPKPLRQPLAELSISSNNILLPQQSQHLHGASGSSLYKGQSFSKQDMSLLSPSRIETSSKGRTGKPQQNAELFNSVPLPPSTPMPLRQPLAEFSITSDNMLLPQQSQHLHRASGSSLYKGQSFSKQDMILLSRSSFETSGKGGTGKPQQNAELFNSVPLPPSTPMPLRQPLADFSISSNNMLLPQQSQHLHRASGSSLYKGQSFSKQDMILLSRSRFETSGKGGTGKPQQNAELFNSVPLPPSTPMPLRQPLAEFFSSNNMLLPQQSQHLHGASGSSLYKGQSFSKEDMSLLSHSRFETITEERAEDMENLIPSQ